MTVLALCLLSVAAIPGHAQQSPPYAYTTRPITLPPPPTGPPLPADAFHAEHDGNGNYSGSNPAYLGKLVFNSYGVNDKGDVAFSIAWQDHSGTWHGAVYAESGWNGSAYAHIRRVVATGDKIAGRRIHFAYGVQINNAGQVSYAADVRENDTSINDVQFMAIFIEKDLAIRKRIPALS
jgi:hypothetical protein